jgi:predicted ATP-binding protein involved in virulence
LRKILIPELYIDKDKVLLFYQNRILFEYPNSLVAYFQAKRQGQPNPVTTIVKEDEFLHHFRLTGDSFTKLFKQYLVNKKIEQAFHQIDNQNDKSNYIDIFFSTLTKYFREIFEDNNLQLIFQREDFEFYIKLSDGRQLTFDTLSEGFSALLSILMDLFTRVDLIRKQVGDFSYDPCGIVLIDEPETHLHLQLQEQVLPLLTSLFPNVQFIAATHSPAVIASIKNTTIFDLTTKETRTDEVVGRSYSELMVTHFGLDNEYSTEADGIIRQVNDAIRQVGADSEQLHHALKQIYAANAPYISPTLSVELEVMMARLEAKQIAHQ